MEPIFLMVYAFVLWEMCSALPAALLELLPIRLLLVVLFSLNPWVFPIAITLCILTSLTSLCLMTSRLRQQRAPALESESEVLKFCSAVFKFCSLGFSLQTRIENTYSTGCFEN